VHANPHQDHPMNLDGAKMQNGPLWAWARTGALILFLVTGILLLASLNAAHSRQSPAFPPGALEPVKSN
jgi:hypothetical protein